MTNKDNATEMTQTYITQQAIFFIQLMLAAEYQNIGAC